VRRLGRDDDRLARADQGVVELAEEERRRRRLVPELGGVRGVVASDANDLHAPIFPHLGSTHRDEEDPMALSFGVTVLPDPPYQRMIELIQLAEKLGFEYAWTYDSHVLWQESMPTLALTADRTSKIKLGHMVTNPGTREPTVLASAYATLHDISNGRMVMGIGRGDSARRYIGQQP